MSRSLKAEINHWLHGVRFYLACATLLVTVEVWWWASVSYGGTVLFATRMTEVYAWLATVLIAVAVTIGPLYNVYPKLPAKKIMYDARRLFGVSAAWFACLHVGIAYVSLFKLANPFSLPSTYKQSFLIGGIALLILLAMAFTSFDKAFRGMGIWWFRLHRLVYAALLLILLHAFMIGAHATHWPALILLTAGALLVIVLQIYIAFVRQSKPTIWQVLTISYTVLLMIAIFNYGYGQKLGYNPIEGKHAHHHV
jgi:DMSO/TMAO reductase YedYZ heme-binding membrane subunit